MRRLAEYAVVIAGVVAYLALFLVVLWMNRGLGGKK